MKETVEQYMGKKIKDNDVTVPGTYKMPLSVSPSNYSSNYNYLVTKIMNFFILFGIRFALDKELVGLGLFDYVMAKLICYTCWIWLLFN